MTENKFEGPSQSTPEQEAKIKAGENASFLKENLLVKFKVEHIHEEEDIPEIPIDIQDEVEERFIELYELRKKFDLKPADFRLTEEEYQNIETILRQKPLSIFEFE